MNENAEVLTMVTEELEITMVLSGIAIFIVAALGTPFFLWILCSIPMIGAYTLLAGFLNNPDRAAKGIAITSVSICAGVLANMLFIS